MVLMRDKKLLRSTLVCNNRQIRSWMTPSAMKWFWKTRPLASTLNSLHLRSEATVGGGVTAYGMRWPQMRRRISLGIKAWQKTHVRSLAGRSRMWNGGDGEEGWKTYGWDMVVALAGSGWTSDLVVGVGWSSAGLATFTTQPFVFNVSKALFANIAVWPDSTGSRSAMHVVLTATCASLLASTPSFCTATTVSRAWFNTTKSSISQPWNCCCSSSLR